eukprot:6189903-Pleurochrysis_carterae.AAC.4
MEGTVGQVRPSADAQVLKKRNPEKMKECKTRKESCSCMLATNPFLPCLYPQCWRSCSVPASFHVFAMSRF